MGPLTGLPGNNLIHQELQNRIEKGMPFALGYVDIDNFKAFNDRYGPDMGDKAIYILSRVIHRAVEKWGNPNDFIGHIGGDDFVFLSSPDRIEKLCALIPRPWSHVVRYHGVIAPNARLRGGSSLRRRRPRVR